MQVRYLIVFIIIDVLYINDFLFFLSSLYDHVIAIYNP